MATRAIRGAITISENTKNAVTEGTIALLKDIIEKNHLDIDDIISIIFTVTKDVNAGFPAAAARLIGITNAGLLDFPQLETVDGLKMCIRTMMYVESDLPQKEMRHSFLRGASVLRKDLMTDEKYIAVALDGPAGSGKSTIAKMVAKELGFTYIDTGAMYRSVAFYCISKDIDYNNEVEVLKVLDNIKISIVSTKRKQVYLLNNTDVSHLIRSPEVSAGASAVATYKGVRDKLVAMQRDLAKRGNVIMDGRDIGTNVLPNAEIKIYMDGNVEERAKRRFEELDLRGVTTTYEDVLEDIKHRDQNDTNRKYNPLRRADDAVFLDTTELSIEEVKDFIVDKIKEYKKGEA